MPSPKRIVAKPVERKRLGDLAYDAIREGILSGTIAMNARLIETQLSEDLGMSRAPIREALRRLSEEGLAVEHPHHGTSVTTIDAQGLADLYNVRLGLEPIGLRGFMARGESVEPLTRLVEKMQKAAARGDRAAVVRAEFDFHRHIADNSGNKLLAGLFADLEGLLVLALRLDDDVFEDLGEIAAEHQPIVDAISSGDVSVAIAVLESHIVSTVGEVLARLGGDPTTVLAPPAPR